ncbi:plexin-C1-like [Sinocyclocheilus rhinocerous]|nr:PREDICTED: plexin-C1-like [Sinocyclocheilus rhinocerous]
MCKMRRHLLGILVLLKYCICGDVQDFDGDIKDFVVGDSKLFVLTDRRLHQMRHDLYEEKRKDITRVNILVPFDTNGTLITCGTFQDGYCEVLDINDITNSIFYESDIPLRLRQNEKSVAFIAGTYLLVGKKDDDANLQDTRYSVVSLLSTLHSQPGGIFSRISEGSEAIIQSTVRDVEFVDGFQRVSPSESYLFLNAKTDYESKVLVLRMNSSKGKKTDIIKSLQAATIRCYSGKVRPVLVACTVIPSVNGVIWAGVFSAQNQQDPENSVLALYNISNVQGRVKGFCAYGEKCDSESDTELQPLSVVFKYSSMSAVAATSIESWIVLFIGTSDGQLIKLVLNEKFTPGCTTVLYKSDDERAVLPRMHFDPVDSKHIYIALKKQVRRVSIVQCGNYSILKDCRAALDPLCGWCLNSLGCSTQDECSNTSWVSIPKNSLQTQLFSFQMTENSSRKITLYLSLSLESTGNPAFTCAFTTGTMKLCDGSDLSAVFPTCSCSFSDQKLYTGVSATVTIEDQKITEMMTLKNCSSITDNSPNASYTQCVQCISAGCHWSSSSKRCEWAHGRGPQLNIQDACKHLLSEMVYDVSIQSLEPNKVSFHGRNNVLLRGRNLESVTKIRIQGDLYCIPKESPVFDRSSDTLRFHIPPSGTKGTVKVCVVTPDDRCHGNSIITYSSQPSCTGIQPTVTWSSGGRKIHIQGSNLELVESVTVLPFALEAQYNTSLGDMWFHSPPYDGGGQFSFLLNVGNSTVDCVDYFSYKPDPEFTGFTTLQVANDLQVNIQKKKDDLNLNISEVNVTGVHGDQQYRCVLEKIESNAVICTIKGESGAVTAVDSLTIIIGGFSKDLEPQNGSIYFLILAALILLIILGAVVGFIVHRKSQRQMNERMNKQLEMLESNIRRDIRQVSVPLPLRCTVASLLTLALHGDLLYLTEVMEDLLQSLMDQSSNANPKLLLRRTESIVEKLLTNWMSICLYGFLRESVGQPLFLLVSALTQQISKGPVDSVTEKALYTLSEDWLLCQAQDFEALKLKVVFAVGTGGEVSEPLEVNALTCDTIQQVKEKILQTFQRKFGFLFQQIRDIEIEYEKERKFVMLQEVDESSEIRGHVTMLNTLKHYQVGDGSCIKVITTKVHAPLRSQSSVKDDENFAVKYFHLVDPDIDTDLSKHPEKKALKFKEMYLTKLLSTKVRIIDTQKHFIIYCILYRQMQIQIDR